MIILDTGPLVAYLNRYDQYHEWATQTLARYPCPLVTCEAVLAESAHLLRKLHDGPQRLTGLVSEGYLRIPFRLEEDAKRVEALMRKYASVPMDLADACLVCMTESEQAATVITLDHDFLIYRRHKRQKIPIVTPFGA